MDDDQPREDSARPMLDDSATNPYAPTAHTSDLAAAPASDVEGYRRAHLNHEASVKSIGTLYLIGAVILLPLSLGMAFTWFTNPSSPAALVVALLYLAFGLFQGAVGWGVYKLAPWTRIPAVIYSVLGLLWFPIGTLVSAYFLYLLLSEKGRVVFSPEYRRVIEQTPHVKYKTSIVVWVFLGLLLLLVGVIAIAAVFAGV